MRAQNSKIYHDDTPSSFVGPQWSPPCHQRPISLFLAIEKQAVLWPSPRPWSRGRAKRTQLFATVKWGSIDKTSTCRLCPGTNTTHSIPIPYTNIYQYGQTDSCGCVRGRCAWGVGRIYLFICHGIRHTSVFREAWWLPTHSAFYLICSFDRFETANKFVPNPPLFHFEFDDLIVSSSYADQLFSLNWDMYEWVCQIEKGTGRGGWKIQLEAAQMRVPRASLKIVAKKARHMRSKIWYVYGWQVGPSECRWCITIPHPFENSIQFL